MLASKNRHAFDRPVDRLDDPMLIVTAEANGGRAGCLAGLATQCSIDLSWSPALPLAPEPHRRSGRAGGGGRAADRGAAWLPERPELSAWPAMTPEIPARRGR